MTGNDGLVLQERDRLLLTELDAIWISPDHPNV